MAPAQSRSAADYVLLATDALSVDRLTVTDGDIGVLAGMFTSRRPLMATASAVAASAVRLDEGSSCGALFASGARGDGQACGPARGFLRFSRQGLIGAQLSAPFAALRLGSNVDVEGRLFAADMRLRRSIVSLPEGSHKSTTTTISTTLPPVARCGNGVVDCGEECDDSNTSDCDGCNADGEVECGNGVIDAECDEVCDGDDVAGQTCPGGTVTCAPDCRSVDRSHCPASAVAPHEICGNCVDDDLNGLVDFEDLDIPRAGTLDVTIGFADPAGNQCAVMTGPLRSARTGGLRSP